MNLEKLKEPFPEKDLEWRIQSAGSTNGKVWARVLTYITNRAIMDRLDEVVGVGNWKNEFKEWMKDSILCGISIKIDGEWVCKWDGADGTDIEATKGGLSGAMKRAGVQWGIGRYLYNLDAEYAIITPDGKHYQPKKDGKYEAFKWNPPMLPKWALPDFPNTIIINNDLFDKCMTQADLKSLWLSLDKEDQKAYKDLKDQAKKRIGE
jgi:hypothetical protein